MNPHRIYFVILSLLTMNPHRIYFVILSLLTMNPQAKRMIQDEKASKETISYPSGCFP